MVRIHPGEPKYFFMNTEEKIIREIAQLVAEITFADYEMKNIPDKNYRMNKQLKTMLAGIQDPEYRATVKHLMIDAELVSTVKSKKPADPKPE